MFEEFIPIKWSSSSSDEQDKDGAEIIITNNSENNGDKTKSDWLRSVQLWNQSPDPHPKEVTIGKKYIYINLVILSFNQEAEP